MDSCGLNATILIMEVSRSLKTENGTSLHYRLTRGDTTRQNLIILLHGVASNLTRWSEFVEYTTLKNSWDVLRLDMRGHGDSLSRGPLGMEVWCQDLMRILDAESYAQAVLIGHSLGAQVAMQFAARYPARTRGLVLIDPIFPEALHGDMRTASRLKPLIWTIIFFLRLLGKLGLHRRHIPKRDLRKLDEETREKLLDAGKQEEMIKRYSSVWEDLKYFPVANYLQETMEVIRPLPPLTQIQAPVLVLLSAGVTYADPTAARKSLAALANLEIVSINAYHWPLTEKPLEVRAAIEKWCERFTS